MTDGNLESGLDFTKAERAELGKAALDWIVEWFEYPSDRPLSQPVAERYLQRAIEEPLPLERMDPALVLQQFSRIVMSGVKDAGNPRHFGYVHSTHAFVGVLGDFFASALNQNVTSWRSAPLATAIERQTINWIKTIVGFEPDAEGLLVSGGSMANLIGVAAALAHAVPMRPVTACVPSLVSRSCMHQRPLTCRSGKRPQFSDWGARPSGRLPSIANSGST